MMIDARVYHTFKNFITMTTFLELERASEHLIGHVKKTRLETISRTYDESQWQSAW